MRRLEVAVAGQANQVEVIREVAPRDVAPGHTHQDPPSGPHWVRI
jgi:hypothetical protein